MLLNSVSVHCNFLLKVKGQKSHDNFSINNLITYSEFYNHIVYDNVIMPILNFTARNNFHFVFWSLNSRISLQLRLLIFIVFKKKN